MDTSSSKRVTPNTTGSDNHHNHEDSPHRPSKVQKIANSRKLQTPLLDSLVTSSISRNSLGQHLPFPPIPATPRITVPVTMNTYINKKETIKKTKEPVTPRFS
ncbi:hypothetical protein P8452_47429 [Trifolium repens]|nr:hypothetical protein P8452_47429 [Trifolium repens]